MGLLNKLGGKKTKQKKFGGQGGGRGGAFEQEGSGEKGGGWRPGHFDMCAEPINP